MLHIPDTPPQKISDFNMGVVSHPPSLDMIFIFFFLCSCENKINIFSKLNMIHHYFHNISHKEGQYVI